MLLGGSKQPRPGWTNPEASKRVDNNGRTLWHMLVNQPPSMTKELISGIGEKAHLIKLLEIQDKEGKTPLHLALESRRFTQAEHFLMCSDKRYMRNLLEIEDGNGITSGDLIASIRHLPQDLEYLFNGDLEELMGYRSVYGISTEEMKDYVNTIMGVIAALLTTITFTAAFTVPGETVQDDKDVKDKHAVGTPLLIKSVAFQAFMFFDILTMCLSTMVLFCLLWIFATGSKRKSVILMDFTALNFILHNSCVFHGRNPGLLSTLW
uniref:PGG domain-containing protein n=1 Tax=Chenopodium quinoa TaxID=63459 RepID=A0A803LAC5_CHEQI